MLAQGVLLQNRYSILYQLGGGGMGTVYAAEDTRLRGRRCAVKEVSPNQLAPQDRVWAMNAFRQEAQILARLQHPGLTVVTDFFDDGGNSYLVMDFVEGETLEARLQRATGGSLALAETLNILNQLCDVLAYLHHQQPPIVFRDLKPANVMLTPRDQVKLIDFGIARFFKSGQTRDTVNLGTPGYAAPEQYGQKGQTDPRSDIYSLGALLHQMLTGHDPTTTPFNLPPVRSLNPGLSPKLEVIIQRATQVQPDARFQNVPDFRQALSLTTQAFLQQEEAAARKRRVVAAALGAGVVLLFGIFFALSNNGASALVSTPTRTATSTPTASPTKTTSPTLTPTPTPTLTPPNLPDLVIVGFRTEPDRPVAGSRYQEIHVVRNNGNAASGASIMHVAWNDGGATEFAVPPLNAGESAEIAQTVRGADSIVSSWRGAASLDYYNVVQESDESNNGYVVSYSVVAPSGSASTFVPGPLTIGFSENSKSCKNASQYVIVFSVYANGGKPPYTYYRDIDRIGGPTNRGVLYSLTYGEGSAAVGAFKVVDSAGQQNTTEFFSRAMNC